MSSRIIRAREAGDFQPLVWTGWSTESVDRKAPLPPPEPADPGESSQRLQRQIEAARQQGFKEGEAAGAAACRREMQDAARQMAIAVRNAVTEQARLRAEAERDVVRIALAIAQKILRREVRIDPHVAIGLVKAAMEAVGAREVRVVRTHPALVQPLAGGLSQIGVPEGVQVVPDASLEPGGLIVETTRGEVDASLETQFEEISTGLLQAVSGGAPRR